MQCTINKQNKQDVISFLVRKMRLSRILKLVRHSDHIFNGLMIMKFLQKMFTLIFFTVILIIAVYYIKSYNKIPKEIENIPFISIFPFIWASIQKKRLHEILKCLSGPDIYLVCIL